MLWFQKLFLPHGDGKPVIPFSPLCLNYHPRTLLGIWGKQEAHSSVREEDTEIKPTLCGEGEMALKVCSEDRKSGRASQRR